MPNFWGKVCSHVYVPFLHLSDVSLFVGLLAVLLKSFLLKGGALLMGELVKGTWGIPCTSKCNPLKHRKLPKTTDALPGLIGGNLSVSSCCWILWNSDLEAGMISPRHIQGIRRWQSAPGLLKSHAAQSASSTCKHFETLLIWIDFCALRNFTMADGCSLLVRIIFGYIAPTSK